MAERLTSAFVGQTLDRYQTLAHQGRAAWGDIFLAYDPKFDRRVVLHVLDPQLNPAEPETPGSRILQNGRAMLAWRHSAMARLFDIGVSGPQAFLVSEYLPGASLAELLHRLRQEGRWILLPEAVAMLREIALALDYAHAHGVVHGQLTPESIYFRPGAVENLPYQPVLVELGLSLPGATSADDLYAAGALLYELCNGELPPGSSAENPYQQPLPGDESQQELSPEALRPDLPDRLKETILKAIDRRPQERFADSSALAAALDECWPLTVQITAPPPAFSEAVSLLPPLQESFKEALKPSETPPALAGSPPSLPAGAEAAPTPESELTDTLPVVDLSQDRIHVLEPNQNIRSIPMRLEGLTIGRGKTNEITLDFPGISRHHAHIQFDGKDYRIVDLKSMNGTFLEERRLPPNQPTVWQPGENVRIGEVWLRLERAGQSHTTVAAPTPGDRPEERTTVKSLQATEVMLVAPDGRALDANQVKFSAGPGWVGAYLDPINLSIAPGTTMHTMLLLFNRGPKRDAFRISISGISPDWLVSPPKVVNIGPGEQQEVGISINPRRLPESRAGRHTANIRVSSQNDPGQSVDLRLSLTITAFSSFSGELNPRQVRGNAVGQVLVHNRGNTPETYSLVWDDPEAALAFEPPNLRVTIPEGKSAAVEFRASLIQPRWIGREMHHPFNVHIASQAGQRQTVAGEYVSRALAPAWAPPLLGAMCVILACFMLLFYNLLTAPGRSAERTAQANQTQVALLTTQTAAGATATASALANANQATLQAVTATAAWLALDLDGDGLSNSQELAANTRPDLADTDLDGLNDGDEVRLWKTDPLKADSDGDGLKDGDEVARNLNPLNPDSDGDGIPDNIDPDPLRPPTKTPLIFPTLTFTPPGPSATPTRTPTSTLLPPPTTVDLTISLSNGQTSSIPGNNVTYTIQVTNRGPAQANNTRVVNTFPGSISNITWNCSATPGSSCALGSGIGGIDTFVNLAPNGSATFQATGKISPSATGLLINNASVSPPPGLTELNNADNLAIDTDTLTPKVTFTFTKTDNLNSVSPGQNTVYTIQVKNNGPSAVSGVNISDSFPAQLTNVTWTCNATPGSSCNTAGVQPGDINTSVNLAADGSATITANATVKPDAAGTLSNTALLTSPIDPSSNNKSATDTTAINPQANLTVDVTTTLTTPVNSVITYTITITNSGPAQATGIEFTDDLPLGVSLVNTVPGSPTCSLFLTRLSCNLGNLPAGSAIVVKVALRMPLLPSAITTVVEAKATETDPNPLDNKVSTTVTVE